MTQTGRGWPFEPVDTRAAPITSEPAPVVVSVREPAAGAPAEPAAPIRTPALVALVVMTVVAVVLTGFSLLDWYSRNRELDVLLTRIQRAEQAQRHDLLDPLLRDCYFSDRGCDAVTIAQVAARNLPELRASGEAVAQTRLTRYHSALRDLRDRYVEHNLAWQARFVALSQGSTEPDSTDDIATTWYDVGRSAHSAIPPFPLHDARSRVDRIFGPSG